jgi:4-hydroxy-tetrahydrodipicolinate synthase
MAETFIRENQKPQDNMNSQMNNETSYAVNGEMRAGINPANITNGKTDNKTDIKTVSKPQYGGSQDLSNPLWTALVTPLNRNGKLDENGLIQLIGEQEKAGNGILILGSTGESLNLTLAEKHRVVELAVSLKPEVPLMVGVAGHDLASVLEWIGYLETLPVQAYLMVTPIYSKPGAEGQYQWFKTLMDRSTRPVMLYNVPGRTACALNLEAVERLSNHPRFWAIKEASGSVEQFRKYRAAAGRGEVYSGDDAMIPDFASFGASGLVSVASNAWPAATRLYTRMALDMELKQLDIGLWKVVCETLFMASNPVPVKALLASLGRISSPMLKLPLHHNDLKTLDPLLEASENVETWFLAHSAYYTRELENA